MNAIKKLTAATVLMLISIITGCSDEYLSPLSSFISNENSSTTDVPSTHFELVTSLKAGEVISFDKQNTGLTSIEAISIDECDKNRGQLEVTGINGDMAFLLDCDLKGFYVTTLSIQNIWERDLQISIHLYGKVDVIPDPVRKEKDNE